MTGDIFPPRPHLRAPAPRRRLEVRLHVLDGRSAFGRSKPFRLLERDLAELVEIATRMERRA